MKRISHFPFICLIYFYRLFISPLFPKTCRFTPSCSEYAAEAYKTHSPYRATLLTFKRIIKCHPWGPYRFDPVPPIKDHKEDI